MLIVYYRSNLILIKTSLGKYKGLQEYNLFLYDFDLCGTLTYESSKQLQINIFLLV